MELESFMCPKNGDVVRADLGLRVIMRDPITTKLVAIDEDGVVCTRSVAETYASGLYILVSNIFDPNRSEARRQELERPKPTHGDVVEQGEYKRLILNINGKFMAFGPSFYCTGHNGDVEAKYASGAFTIVRNVCND